jgi:hypothetical protein
MKNEQRSVGLGLNESDGASEGGEALKPCAWRLFKAIEGFEKTTNMSWILRINEAGRLLAIDNFIEMTVKEGVLNV